MSLPEVTSGRDYRTLSPGAAAASCPASSVLLRGRERTLRSNFRISLPEVTSGRDYRTLSSGAAAASFPGSSVPPRGRDPATHALYPLHNLSTATVVRGPQSASKIICMQSRGRWISKYYGGVSPEGCFYVVQRGLCANISLTFQAMPNRST